MIFKHIKEIKDKNEKKFFIEKINIINELVKKYCILHHLTDLSHLIKCSKAQTEVL